MQLVNVTSQHIDEMAENVEKQFSNQIAKKCAFQFDESTLRDNEAILMVQVLFLKLIMDSEKILFTRSLKIDTKGKTIFKVLPYFKENNIPLKNIMACKIMVLPSIIGRYRSFILYLTMLCLKYFAYTVKYSFSIRFNILTIFVQL